MRPTHRRAQSEKEAPGCFLYEKLESVCRGGGPTIMIMFMEGPTHNCQDQGYLIFSCGIISGRIKKR